MHSQGQNFINVAGVNIEYLTLSQSQTRVILGLFMLLVPSQNVRHEEFVGENVFEVTIAE